MKICNDMPQGVYFENEIFHSISVDFVIPNLLPGIVTIFLKWLFNAAFWARSIASETSHWGTFCVIFPRHTINTIWSKLVIEWDNTHGSIANFQMH